MIALSRYSNFVTFPSILSNKTLYLFQNEDVARENITETLGTMAKVCLRMLENP